VRGRDDGLVRVAPVLGRVKRFADLIAGEADEAGFAALRAAGRIGRTLANKARASPTASSCAAITTLTPFPLSAVTRIGATPARASA
jgi:hypothetical protein